MQVGLSSLEGSRGKFAHDYSPGELSLDDERASLATPPRIAGRIKRSEIGVVVEGEISADLQLECDRCLNTVELPVASIFNVEYVTTDVYQARQTAELLEEDLALSVFDGETIDIDEIVREQLLLTLPYQVLCEENCKGLCPNCGVNRNFQDCECQQTDIDPRWTGLKEIGDRKL